MPIPDQPTFKDFILVFPDGSGIKPFYIALAESGEFGEQTGYSGGRNEQELEDLAIEPNEYIAKDKGITERKVGLALEERGDLGHIVRDTQSQHGADYIDITTGIKWDVKSFESYPIGADGKLITKPSKGAFKVEKAMINIRQELMKGNNVIINTSKLSLVGRMGQQKARYFHFITFIGITCKIIANRVLINSRAWRHIPSLLP